MVGKTENILVDFDYNNIIVVDPNKVVDDKGNVKDRNVKQEDLVMYVNLECKVIPRTKLAVGIPIDDAIQTVSLASINFLKPGDKTYLDNSYTDELTGKDSLKGKGVNQVNQNSFKKPDESDSFYVRQSIKSNGENKATDNGLLGITNVSIRQGLDFTPTFNIKLVDVKGRALFEAGSSSPYAAFFTLPYPPFYLTLKGFFGKAAKYSLLLRTFNASYDGETGNFNVDLLFQTYQFSAIAEVQMGYLLAVPHMYETRYSVTPKTGGPSNITKVDEKSTSKGFLKIREMYNEYKSKGLITNDFPELTLLEMRNRIENFVTNILDSYTKQNLDPLTNIDVYTKTLNEYMGKVFYYAAGEISWFNKYMDTSNFLILNELDSGPTGTNMASQLGISPQDASKIVPGGITGGSQKTYKIYTFKPEIKTPKEREDAISKLKGLIVDYNKLLNDNDTLGINGSYTIDKKVTKSPVPVEIDYDKTFPVTFSRNDINWKETFIQTKNVKVEPSPLELEKFKAEVEIKGFFDNTILVKEDGDLKPKSQWYIFEGKNTFIDKTDKINKDAIAWRSKIQDELTQALAKLLQSSDSGIGFVPSLRNVLAVIFANGEAFLRLLDDVHTAAWNVREAKERKEAIFKPETSSANPDNMTSGSNEKQPIYPWPTYMVLTNGEDGHELFEIRYPGEPTSAGQTKSFLTNIWPEVEFVEEFIKGFTTRDKEFTPTPVKNSNQLTEPNRITLNAIEFPITNNVYENKEEVKFFYEIYERLFLISNYSRLNRSNGYSTITDIVARAISESEKINIVNSLSSDNPFLIKKLKEYGFNSNNFVETLRNISNGGVGLSYQNYERGIFNTPYIKNITQTDNFVFIDNSVIDSSITSPLVNLQSEPDFSKYINESTTSNVFDILDVYPFTSTIWCKKYLADNSSFSKSTDVFNTTKSLTYNPTLKVISNFGGSLKNNVPITNNIYQSIVQPKIDDYATLKDFYISRLSGDKQIVTEGNLNYVNYSGGVNSDQTVSMLNTPYFINSIQQGVKLFREFNKHPFVTSAYLFLNSLPLSTLREKYTVYENGVTSYSDYIYSTIKKFGGLHRVPYAWVLKMGSIWYRYKRYVNDNVDILDDVWTNFNSSANFDPINSASTKNYALRVNGGNVDIVLEKNTTIGTETSTVMNVGFYPKVINDFNLFYQGFQPFSGYTTQNIQDGIDGYGVNLVYVNSALVKKEKGFDSNDDKRDLRIIPWSVYIESTDATTIFPLPSMGSTINQTDSECFKKTPLKSLIFEVTGNTSVYNGSVRQFWSAPNYGYYDNNNVIKPNHDNYIKEILSGTTQPNFTIDGVSLKYSEISELFSAFEKDVLDKFEDMFLDFSKSKYDVPDGGQNLFGSNYQNLMIEMMRIPKQTGNTPSDLVKNIQTEQLSSINNTISKFLGITLSFKYGNPSLYDKRLIYTFSNYNITDPYIWEEYAVTTPNALPINGGGITLASSKLNYPNEWKTLLTYVGYSEIPELVYSNNGSYITDFFVDFNIAFTEGNIKNFAPIIKVYATQKLTDTVTDVAPPASLPDKNSFAVLTNGDTVTVNVVGNHKVMIITNNNKDVIFSEPKGFLVSMASSDETLIEDTILNYYGDFGLIDNPIVDLFIRPKGLKTNIVPKSNFNKENFKRLMDIYIGQNVMFLNKSLNNLMIQLQKDLPDVNNTPQPVDNSVVTGTQAKVDYWTSFQALNNKWVAGHDFSNKTLFEDILILDRASRNIGDKVLVDIFKLKIMIDNLFKSDVKGDMQLFVETLLTENNFVYHNLPSYVNFYNVQEVSKNAKPSPEGSLEFANTMFGNFMNVDTKNTSAKMVCVYSNQGSSTVAVNNVDFKFSDDAFDIRKPSNNPLVENQVGKNDFALSNKVVGFNVDIGVQNQSMFNGFSVSQSTGKATAESLEVENMMANVATNKAAATQNISLYNLYKTRSYTCTINMLGNALLQPTMYFNLRYVPMFYGPYMITEINHSIGPGVFDTTVTGIRQPTAALPKVEDYLQTIRVSLLKKIEEEIKNKATENNDKVIQASNNTTNTYENIDTPVLSTVGIQSVVNKIITNLQTLGIPDDGKLKYVVFSAFYLYGDVKNDVISGYQNNFLSVNLKSFWGDSGLFEQKFFCLSNGTAQAPMASFSSVGTIIEMYLKRWKDRVSVSLKDLDPINVANFIIANIGNSTSDLENSMANTPSMDTYKTKVETAIKIFNDCTNVSTPPKPKQLNPLVDKYTYAITSPPLFESLTITVDPKIDGPRIIWSVDYDYDINAPCANETGSKATFNTNYISKDKQSKGSYKFKIMIYTSPVNADGTPDNSRTDFYKSYPITFTL